MLTANTRVLATMAAQDNGWEIPPLMEPSGWLRCASSLFEPLTWIGANEQGLILATNRAGVLMELARQWPKADVQTPGLGGVCIGTTQHLAETMRRAAALSRSLPDNVSHSFKQKVAALPKTTEAERLVVQRIGQNLFRQALLDYWGGRCAVTGLDLTGLLRASHIKPWARCDTDEERLDVYNGLLLAPHLDALFDGGWMTFDPDGLAIWSPQLPAGVLDKLGLSHQGLFIAGLTEAHQKYLNVHRATCFRGKNAITSGGKSGPGIVI